MRMVPLSSVTRIVSGGTPKTSVDDYWDGDIPWATPKDLSGLNSVQISDTPRKITQLGLRQSSAEVLPKNSVLFSSRAPIGLLAINTVPMATNQGFKSFIPNPDEVNSRYLYRWLEKNRLWLQSLGVGATFKEVSKAIVSRLEMPIPPLDEQRHIAATLDKADELRAKRREALAHLDALTKSIFHDMFGRHRHENMTLGEICGGDFRNGVSPSSKGSVASQVLTLSAVTGTEFKPTASKPGLFDREIPSTQRVSKDYLLICRGNGNLNFVGRGHFPSTDMTNTAFPDTIIAARPKSDIVLNAYLDFVWNTPNVRSQIERVARTTNGTFKVNQESLASTLLQVPPVKIQRQFATRIAAVERLKEHHRTQLAELDTLFASLQYHAFKGEL